MGNLFTGPRGYEWLGEIRCDDATGMKKAAVLRKPFTEFLISDTGELAVSPFLHWLMGLIYRKYRHVSSMCNRCSFFFYRMRSIQRVVVYTRACILFGLLPAGYNGLTYITVDLTAEQVWIIECQRYFFWSLLCTARKYELYRSSPFASSGYEW